MDSYYKTNLKSYSFAVLESSRFQNLLCDSFALRWLNSLTCDLQKKSKKVAHIHDVWHSGFGVVSLSVFQNVNSAEAFTREAAMIDALGLEHLTNCVRGKCYGVAKDWDKTRLRCYGAFLLLSAMQILLIEGERQIRPNHLSK